MHSKDAVFHPLGLAMLVSICLYRFWHVFIYIYIYSHWYQFF
jgi:hypothetical protein